ncbi:amino acid ABC transporter permease [Achromobacter denitrificans]|uniref:Amino acid ABC transporter permease n=1 Tax=Achromobacter denitrificans TaxID=32002 RepID=A0A427WL34_ACHDE|nr:MULTISPECIES: amino acid ABC transporter permease [Achromobacter]ASC67879.1 amino acid ABC transporter permease [Achromobacter denitrificans]MBV2162322.1 amino acid ABC transporter permease [Achromobacter denitrificans]MDF3852441.1 amino acid ABC transporter permease [Achromobacter denitrificans]MDF3861873.1 amino acid ABC transporter permease [Achromobacter denitrificans]MDX3881917.1 amino acid ABC transporter permease [Achromobacter sp.]
MPIDFSIVGESVPVLLKGLRITALVSLIGIPLGILIGTAAAYAAQSRTLLRPLALAYVELVRNIPYLILVYLSFFGLPKLGVPASAMSVAIGCTAFYTGGYFCEVLRAALKSVPRGQSSAALSLGMTYWQTQRHIVVPQLFGFLIPPTTSLVIMMFKDSAIFSVMSLPEMTYQSNLLTANTFAYLEVLGTTALIYWLCSVLMAGAGRRLETLARRGARQA